MNIDSTLGQRPAAQKPARRTSKFVLVALPWIIAAAALALYLVTLNRWVSFGSLQQVEKVSGWSWQPEVAGPLNWLLTLPLRWLPAKLIPLGLNLFSAICAALTLALLARSVALLPHDRTEQQRVRERSDDSLLSIRSAWLPPLLAAAVCGLQLTFWESATAASGGSYYVPSNQMLDVLVFAYVIRCLLEFRLKDRESWLLRAAVVYGLGMTNDWGMIGFFPLYLVALVWLKGLSFFNARFLTRLSLCGTAGLLLYLVQPLVQHFGHDAFISFWQALKYNLAVQKRTVMEIPFNKGALFQPDRPLWILGLPSLLPLLVMSIRWSSYFGDPSRLGTALASLIFHVVHGALLVVSLWVCLDAPFSPRRMVPGLPFLSLYYLAALSVGYLSGYFLLVFGTKPDPLRALRSGNKEPVLFDPLVALAVWLLAIVTPAAMVYQNLPHLRTTNGPLLRQYAAMMVEGVSTNRAVLLSDYGSLLSLVRAEVAGKTPGRDYVYLDSALMKYPDYLRFLNRQYPKRVAFPVAKDQTRPLEDLDIMTLVGQLAQSNAIYYLHPSFGYYFELFYAETHGLVSRLQPVLATSLTPPPPSPELMAENEAFWARFDQGLAKPLQTATSTTRGSTLVEEALLSAGLTKEANADALTISVLASRARNKWGVDLQRGDHIKEAALHFLQAQSLNPDNLSAKYNLDYNYALQKGEKSSVGPIKSIEDQFPKYRTWDPMLLVNGPLDEPTLCFHLGQTLMRGMLYRQAGIELARVKTLAPDNDTNRLQLAFLYLRNQIPKAALQEIQELRAQGQRFAVNLTNQSDLIGIEAAAHLALNDAASARQAVESALKRHTEEKEILAAAVRIFMDYGSYSNALPWLEQQLRANPTNVDALINQGFAQLQLSNYQAALAPLNRALELETNNYLARFDRAVACLQAEQFEAAQRDYEVIQKAYPAFYQAYYGLQEIAFRKQDTNGAIRNCQLYLSRAPTNTEEAKAILERLQNLKHPGATNRPPAAAKGKA